MEEEKSLTTWILADQCELFNHRLSPQKAMEIDWISPNELIDNNKAECVRIFTDLPQWNEQDSSSGMNLLFKNLSKVSPKEITKAMHCKKAIWYVW